MKNILYWFTHDLRVNDNPALKVLEKADALLCVYCIEETWFESQPFQVPTIGSNRLNTLKDALFDLRQSLKGLNQELMIALGSRVSVLKALIKQYQISHLVCSRQFGWYERTILNSLQHEFPNLAVIEVDSYTLFTPSELPFSLSTLPDTFSSFRKQLPKPSELRLSLIPKSLTPKPIAKTEVAKVVNLLTLQALDELKAPDAHQHTNLDTKTRLFGGERAAIQHVKEYFSADAPSTYKETRNQLEGKQFSSKLSMFLSQGSISVLKVLQHIHYYEQTNVKNDSTQWLFMELLWREYFQWLSLKIGPQLYQFKGNAKSKPLTSFYSERFKKWCEGETPYRLVNACMQELKQTGYLSNRGRQIVASACVNELGLDWRYGAAWFECCLIDYDVAVNWGNWQYIAGIGADPRGGRHFNLTKQTQLFDPEGHYQKKWSPNHTLQPLDSQDYVGWPTQCT